ncbi:Versiconal hemiacetal acetate reductase [Exophiala dermatitidis]|uniref:Aldo-keto reductase n=1 Tax=Exophiala dermatitidis (strain ATCC 34100 / CBS 525.76 / NIH/UT8656) TaxID=858893 RepID=H6CA09_EXODN|nr:aldo-keto reductase [Exophiala dermatitidis NIH/UT8656]EHY60820.1 aldo-keto reductase [Exophiala dermatitidis NIH/UT8656]
MEYQYLGRSGLKVSKVILGAMSYGTPEWKGWVLNEEESLPLLEYAYKVGIRTWDTADVYSNGRSEAIIGKAIKKYNIPRERLVILSKCYFGVTPDALERYISANTANEGDLLNQVGLSRKHILDAVDKSVARLGTYIDVLQIHRLDRSVPREEIMRALNDVVESGKVRYIGASSMAAWEFQELQNIADRHGWHKFISMQNYYNLLYREEENEMIPYCNHTGVGLIPWSPVARGALARPWNSRDSLREKTDNFLQDLVRSRDDKVDEEIVGRVEQVAKKLGKSMAQIAIAWALSKKDVSPIVGLNKKERIDEAVEACKIKLSEEDIKFLEEPYQPKRRQGY